MDQQGQNGLMTTFREGWRNQSLVAFLISALLFAFYGALYFTDVGSQYYEGLNARSAVRGLVLLGALIAVLGGVYAINKKAVAWLVSGLLIAFYASIYFTDTLQGAAEAIGLRSKWLLYGLLYTVAMTIGAVYYLRRHGNSAYNRRRIAVNLLVQLLLAFSLPAIMPYFFTSDAAEYSKYEAYLSYLWPLAWYDLQPSTLEYKFVGFAVWSVVGAIVVAPLAAIFFGKRWYCSWVCGCGGLANTFGDPWRHLTSSTKKSWRFEKAAVYTVLVLAFVSTGLIVADHFVGDSSAGFHRVVAGGEWWSVKTIYGFIVGSVLSGLIGTAVYPLLGPRIWCRNFCPMAALLGLIQKAGRFHIRVKKDMCISCGNCTTYCEMGIDVRAYAQTNESFTRAACVGCGVCAHVCPRGVLKLENTKTKKALPIVV